MNTQNTSFFAGIFIISLTGIFAFSIIWLSSDLSFKKYDHYIVYMKESVSGLNPDAAVEYNGVGVGIVQQISLNAHNPNQVKLILHIKKNTPITRGTVATLNIRGLTGLAYVALQDQGTDLRLLSTDSGEMYPIIKTAPSLLLRLDTALNGILNDFHMIARSIHMTLNSNNRQSFQNILINLQRITDVLAQNSQQLHHILINTASVTKQLTQWLPSSLQTVQTLQTQTLPMTYHALLNMNQAAQAVSEWSAEIKENPAVLIRGKQ